MTKLISIAIVAFALMGCASPDYQQYVAAQQANAAAMATSDTARYQALASIAKTDGSAAVAAAMALALGGQRQTQIAAPQPNQILQWASIIVPALGQAYAIGKSADVSIAASNNAVRSTEAMAGGFVAIAGQIQAPAANVTNTTSTSTILSGTGVLGSGTYSTFANPVTNTTTTNPAGQTCSVDAAGVLTCI